MVDVGGFMNALHQLVDEASATVVSLRRGIRNARELACHMNLPLARYDDALSNLGRLETELRAIADTVEFTHEVREKFYG